MKVSLFFIDRPILAWAMAIIVMMIGVAAVLTLPIAQFPDVAPPSISVSAYYPGASAESIETSVTQILEQQLTGIDGLLYFGSSSDSSGAAQIQVTFAKGTDPDTAQVQVQNRVQQAVSRLPSEVQLQGITVDKSNNNILMVLAIFDQSDRSSDADVSDYLTSNLQDELARINGVGRVEMYGSGYAMRIWLDPVKLTAAKLMPSDVATAVGSQNVDLTAGQLGARPAVAGQMLNAVVRTKSRLHTPEQFRAIVVKTLPDGSVVRLSDVARVELGQEDYSFSARMNGHPASGLAIYLAPGGDALKTAKAVKDCVAKLSTRLPPGYAIAFPRDTTDFIRLSVREVVETLILAIILVVLVMFLFLQSWRATLVPAIAVPVVVLGTFGVIAAFGYSINTLTLFAMVLAIGLLVDDAIVVVEGVERILEAEAVTPRDATIRTMQDLGSALFGVALVLATVLLPMAFFKGSSGVIYRQFSVTIISAVLLSVGVALSLSPVICATLLRPRQPDTARPRRIAAHVNRWRDRAARGHAALGAHIIAHRRWHLLGYGIVMILLVWLFLRLPTGFLPTEDRGSAIVPFTLPAGATAVRTDAVSAQIQRYFLTRERRDVTGVFAISGYGLAGSGQNTGTVFVIMSPFEKRSASDVSVPALVDRATAALQSIRDATIYVLSPPTVSGLGQSSGFSLQLLNTGALSRMEFAALRDRLVAAAGKDKRLAQVRASVLPDTPQLRITIDDAKLSVLGLTEGDVTDTLDAAWGSTYINDFIDRGRVKRVYMQADAPYRMLPDDLSQLFVRSAVNGNMVPFTAFATTSWESGVNSVSRFNGHSSYEIDGEAASGVSSGEAMAEIVALQRELPEGTEYAWSGSSLQEQQSSGQAPLLYAISLFVVFLCLAALYESWSVPISVLMAIPLGLIGAIIFVTLRRLDNNIYFQVGLLTTTGLTAKNAILIVEFAELARRQGIDRIEAALEAARVRLRPILMTSLAFVAGVLPLALAHGPGAQARIAIGTAVVGGMLSATLLTIFYVPLFFVVIGRWARTDTSRGSGDI